MRETNTITYPDLQNWMTHEESILEFQLPAELEAGEPPESRGLNRDDVRLMVSNPTDDQVIHTRFHNIVEFLDPGDVLVINTSATMNAALQACRDDGIPLELHLL